MPLMRNVRSAATLLFMFNFSCYTYLNWDKLSIGLIIITFLSFIISYSLVYFCIGVAIGNLCEEQVGHIRSYYISNHNVSDRYHPTHSKLIERKYRFWILIGVIIFDIFCTLSLKKSIVYYIIWEGWISTAYK